MRKSRSVLPIWNIVGLEFKRITYPRRTNLELQSNMKNVGLKFTGIDLPSA